MRVAIFENMKNTRHGAVGTALSDAGAHIDIFRPFLSELLPADADRFDAMVVFGGDQNAMADVSHPYLADLAKLMRAFADTDKPLLGICLGSQLLARAYDANNLIGAASEFGWRDVQITAEGHGDPVFSALSGNFTTFQWHDDTFSLPEGAIRLATNATTANQAFRVGRAAYGMQFHFEADRDVVAHWVRDFPEIIDRKEPGWRERHQMQAQTHGFTADAAGMAIARAWVGLIGTETAGGNMDVGQVSPAK